jgi:hypothetical protein
MLTYACVNYSGVNLLWRKQYACVNLLVRKRAPEQAYGGAGGACEEKGAHEKGAWPPPISPRRGLGRP